ncbi:putative IQ motif, EF-hand binding, leucine-rich repeat domain superfamily [Plasmopara halstedii]
MLIANAQCELEARGLEVHYETLALSERATSVINVQHQVNPDVLDLRPYADEVDDLLLIEMAHQLRANQSTNYTLLILSGCCNFTCVGLRSLVHAVGKAMRQLDCSCTDLSIPMLQVLATGIEHLDEVNFSSCQQLSSEGLRNFISCCNSSLTRLNLSRCGALTDDALGWISGLMGPQSSRTRCRRLLSLDISSCNNVRDQGLAYIGAGCRALRFLNLDGLVYISDAGISHIVRGCNCCIRIGKHGVHLRTLDLSGCYAMSSAGLLEMVQGTTLLQSLNLEGCLRMREEILASVTKACPALQTFNLTGCHEITDAGINTLAERLIFARKAHSYRGLEPYVDGLLIKYSIQEQTIRSSATLRLQAFYRGYIGRCVANSKSKLLEQVSASYKIWRFYTCWRIRRALDLRVKQRKLFNRSAVRIQRLITGVPGRASITDSQVEEQRLVLKAISAVKIQAAFRGFWTRRHFMFVRKYLERFRLEQNFLLRERAADRLQKFIRARCGISHFESLMALNQSRRMAQCDAVVKLQRLYRAFATRRGYRQLLMAIAKQQEENLRLNQIAVNVQSKWRGYRGRQYDLTASLINAGVRGYFDKQVAKSERIRAEIHYCAACVIKRAWLKFLKSNIQRLGLCVMSMLECRHYGARTKSRSFRRALDMVNHEPQSDDGLKAGMVASFGFSVSQRENLHKPKVECWAHPAL